MDVSTTDVSRAVRTFYEGWRANPYFARGKFGGLFALSAAEGRHASSPCRTSPPTTNTCAAVSRPARSPSCPPAASSRARPAPWRASCACVAAACAARARVAHGQGQPRARQRTRHAAPRRDSPADTLPIAFFLLVSLWVRLSLMLRARHRRPRWERDVTSRVTG
jgi:hypothetical protein